MATRRTSYVKKRNLRATATQVGVSRAPVDGRAPRYGPTEYIGDHTPERGALAGRDPLRTGRVFSPWQWLALASWAGMLGGALSLARRRLERD